MTTVAPETSPLADLAPLERALVRRYQRGMPLTPAPFADMARTLGENEAEVLKALRDLTGRGVVARVGPVFRPHAVGASTLAAMAVPPERLEEVGQWISGFAAVNHNYEREHRLNLWFVVTGAQASEVAATLDRIRAGTGLAVLDLPLLADYHIDLAFPLDPRDQLSRARRPLPGPAPRSAPAEPDWPLVRAIQDGLPLVPRPFAQIAAEAGHAEAEVLARLEALAEGGAIKRLGLVVRHHELGFRANGMVVWDIPDAEVEAVGRAMSQCPWVSLCYRRPRRPGWPYNLFTMIHGRDRKRVRAQAGELAEAHGLRTRPREVLFSRRRFKQRGARYA